MSQSFYHYTAEELVILATYTIPSKDLPYFLMQLRAWSCHPTTLSLLFRWSWKVTLPLVGAV